MLDKLSILISQLNLNDSLTLLLSRLTLILIVLIVAWAMNILCRRYLLTVLRSLVEKSQTKWDDIIFEKKVFNRLSQLAPAIVIYVSAGVVFPDMPAMQASVRTFMEVLMIFISLQVISAFLTAVVDIYQQYDVSRDRPIKSYVQVVKLVFYLVAGIFIIATLLNKEPWELLAGLGAMTAVIMLVFKDTILGFVSSIQLTANDMVRRGDWISVPKHNADGDVIDVSLTTIKVQNWDKTISTIPTWSLVNDSFKNWRGMSESGGRRVKRHVLIDMSSIKFCDQAMVDRFSRYAPIKEYVQKKQDEIGQYNQEHNLDSDVLLNGRRLTNIGTFRAYLVHFLKNHPMVHSGMTFLVRQLQPSPEGLPIEIYMFSRDQNWNNYEDLQGDLFDHILAAIPEFDLRVYQKPSGADFQSLK